MDHVLSTARLKLTPLAGEDLADLRAHWRDAQVRRFLFDDEVLNEEDIVETLAVSERDFAAHGYGLWMVRTQDADSLVGTVGLRPLSSLGIEVTYSLSPSAWGCGYATEMARAVVDHGLTTVGLSRVLAEVDEGNAASRHVIEKLGMEPFETVQGVLGPMIRYRTRR
ncbi:GNAT family N-acetyltransferase [Catenulispora yoronensis]|uniref:GNAT family N-acetyltransferase n=1 Tax=Catenulispora yoronensis TaxID=450799 RepID=A0ABP5FQH5_9ACTN